MYRMLSGWCRWRECSCNDRLHVISPSSWLKGKCGVSIKGGINHFLSTMFSDYNQTAHCHKMIIVCPKRSTQKKIIIHDKTRYVSFLWDINCNETVIVLMWVIKTWHVSFSLWNTGAIPYVQHRRVYIHICICNRVYWHCLISYRLIS